MTVHRGAALLAMLVAACAPAIRPSAPTEQTIFDTRADAHFGDATPALRTYLAAVDPRPAGPQHFCILGYTDASGYRAAQVHWREGQRLILWEGATDPLSARDAIRFTRRDLDLTRDVVATEADIDSSTYRVTRIWVDRVLADCAASGARYTISPA